VVSANNVWAVGSYENLYSQIHHALIEHWNGTKWSIVPSPKAPSYYYDTFLSAVTAISANNVWAVGDTCGIPSCGGGSSQNYSPLIEHWDGTSWSVAYGPYTSNNDYLTCYIFVLLCPVARSQLFRRRLAAWSRNQAP